MSDTWWDATIARRLAALGAGQRATGRLIGVDRETIRADIGKKHRGDNSPNTGNGARATGDNSPPDWFQSSDTAAVAQREHAREQQKQPFFAAEIKHA